MNRLSRRLSVESKRVKQEARQVVEKLPEAATWEDPMDAISVRQAIAAESEDGRAGRTVDLKDVRWSWLAESGRAIRIIVYFQD